MIRLVAAGILLVPLPAEAAGAAFGEAGVRYVTVHQDMPFLDCPDDTVRQAVVEVRPTYRSAEATVSGRLAGIGQVDDNNQATPGQADGEVSAAFRQGRDAYRAVAGAGYDNDQATLCFGSVDARLRHEEAVREGREVAGTKTREQHAGAGYTYVGGTYNLLVDYVTRADEGDSRLDTQDLSVIAERHLLPETTWRFGGGQGTETAANATLNITHVMTGIVHHPTARWQVAADAYAVRRSSQEEGHLATVTATYELDTETAAHARFERDLWVQSLRLTETVVESGIVQTTPTLTASASARRTQVDDADHHAGNRYEVAVADTWMPRHTAGIKLTKGTDEVALVRDMTTEELTYAFFLTGAPLPTKGPGNVYAGYAVSQVVDLQGQASDIQTLTAGVLFGF